MPKEHYRDLMTRYKHELAEFEAETEEAPQAKQISSEDILQFRQTLTDGWAAASESERRNLIAAIAPKIHVYPDKLVLRTVLSIGNVTIPTHMFELRDGHDAHDRRGRIASDVSDDAGFPGQCAPDRNDARALPRGSRWALSDLGRNIRCRPPRCG